MFGDRHRCTSTMATGPSLPNMPLLFSRDAPPRALRHYALLWDACFQHILPSLLAQHKHTHRRAYRTTTYWSSLTFSSGLLPSTTPTCYGRFASRLGSATRAAVASPLHRQRIPLWDSPRANSPSLLLPLLGLMQFLSPLDIRRTTFLQRSFWEAVPCHQAFFCCSTPPFPKAEGGREGGRDILSHTDSASLHPPPRFISYSHGTYLTSPHLTTVCASSICRILSSRLPLPPLTLCLTAVPSSLSLSVSSLSLLLLYLSFTSPLLRTAPTPTYRTALFAAYTTCHCLLLYLSIPGSLVGPPALYPGTLNAFTTAMAIQGLGTLRCHSLALPSAAPHVWTTLLLGAAISLSFTFSMFLDAFYVSAGAAAGCTAARRLDILPPAFRAIACSNAFSVLPHLHLPPLMGEVQAFHWNHSSRAAHFGDIPATLIFCQASHCHRLPYT